MLRDERNRPRIKDSTALERNRRRRQRVASEGGRRIEVLLEGEAVRALDVLCANSGQTIRDCVSRALIDAALSVAQKEA